MSERPRGLLVPLTTPFDPSTGDVAPVHLRDHARTMLGAGAAGIVAAGSTGEASLLSEDEYRQVLEWLRDVVPEDRWLVAGAGRESTRATVAACRAAAEGGANAVLVRAPAYYAPVITAAGLLDHFREVADQSPVPLLLYNFPKYTHVALSEALVSGLASLQNVWGSRTRRATSRTSPRIATLRPTGRCSSARDLSSTRPSSSVPPAPSRRWRVSPPTPPPGSGRRSRRATALGRARRRSAWCRYTTESCPAAACRASSWRWMSSVSRAVR